MALDTDGQWPACINLARKNYALITGKGKIKLTGNSIKSKKMTKYIVLFLDKAIKMLLDGDGKGFVEYYYEYVQKIFDQKIPLMQIANKSKVKQSIDDYIARSKTKTKAGALMSRQAHMELAIKENLNVNLGDIIYYVNNGTKASHGDVQKVNKLKKGWTNEQLKYYFLEATKVVFHEGYPRKGRAFKDSYKAIKGLLLLPELDLYRRNNHSVIKQDWIVKRIIQYFMLKNQPLLIILFLKIYFIYRNNRL
jgi:hypothetical protein